MRFDQPAVFAALLDAEEGGRFQIRPVGPFETERRYVGSTNVLETTFRTSGGQLRLTDCMPLYKDGTSEKALRPPHALLRRMECTAGEVEVEVIYAPRFGYGETVPTFQPQGDHLVYAAHETEALALRSEIPLRTEGGAVRGHATLRSGERCTAGLTFARGEPLILPPVGEAAEALFEETRRWWAQWAERCTYDGPYRTAVVRSVLALKMLTYAPSGAIVAAATTSLPEVIGGERNWDYRYCWLRDASYTMRALLDLGYQEEGRAFLGWLLYATNLTWPRLQVFYDVFGRTNMTERTLGHLSGYRGSRPVRAGNAATEQLQLDVYGEVVGAAHELIMRGGRLAKKQVESLRELGEVVCDLWREPDAGIWEARSGRKHHTHSKVMCWRALDGLLRMHRHGHLKVPVEQFEREREAIRDDIEEKGYSADVGSYAQTYDGQTPDASLLLMASQGYCAPDAPRMVSTYAYLKKHLERRGLWYRYPPGEDGLEGQEGTFGICSFWAAEYLARRGEVEAARETFERVLACASDVGLFAEEIDAASGAALGNVPQAFTHVGLINAALALGRAAKGEAPARVSRAAGQEERAADGIDQRK